MFEHVGYKNYRQMMKVVRRCLDPDGLFLLHTIGGNRSSTSFDPWLDAYIFPNAMLPSARQIAAASEGLFVLEDWHNFGPDYDKTLMAWYANFRDRWNELRKRYDRRFYRMWRCYLLTCAGSFRARKNQLWQIVFSPRGVASGYRSVR
jgi:cyclopropane-fatty-acyl-phospholipid synthase